MTAALVVAVTGGLLLALIAADAIHIYRTSRRKP